MADFIARAGIEVVPFTNKQRATFYVDFVGARPAGVEVLSLDLATKGARAPRNTADLATDQWQTAACMVISQALRLKPMLLTADPAMLGAIRSAMGVAASQVPVILSGEIGAGKYAIARIIHSAQPVQWAAAQYQLRQPAGCRCGKSHRHLARLRGAAHSVLFSMK